ncbi:Ribosome association toxin PasT (RatA) of the RatAB toxin-antitoxin module [Dyella jiangningensis]|uniref:type II toxin-antitoxin system RatA family toxin n=1 Tax=Dyella sp. AtDHG13 TaxID=1938897 RepID=UPI00088A475E|nr:type II toxin-antitoxin system RatA family toxin [Dyella sp. AtDHG13]PXV60643.1 ribosome-associated toxin RatA of RatAB toxin-antitoxin module [Dyella sp. AtDHG13]SDJ53440.1 Ribosome association toxin PasT (RatA) of the RatAB toxin-antitoxin module [Dyella jiangningensis]
MIEIRRSALVRYSPAQMFDLVNDVEAYPKRFPWCVGAQVLERTGDVLVARLDLKYAGFRQSFTTRNTTTPPSRLHMSLVDGPFRSLDGVWDFIALGDAGCKVSFVLDFDYASKLMGSALKLGFQGLASRMVEDFCKEAERTYG